MYFEAGTDTAGIEREPVTRVTLALNCLALVALGILPGALLSWCARLVS
jgi:hypothetical protein